MANRYHKDSLFADEKKHRAAPLVLVVLIFVLICMIALYNIILNSGVTLLKQSITISNLPAGLEGFKILHVSDFHGKIFGSAQDQLLEAIEDEKYHAVCITGDLTDSDGNPKAVVQFVSQLPDDIPVFFIAGDEDPSPIITDSGLPEYSMAPYILAIQEAGGIYLDAPYPVIRNSENIWFCPEMLYTLDVDASKAYIEKRIDDLLAEEETPSRNAQLAGAYYSRDRINRVSDAYKSMTKSDIHIALTHVPLTAEGMRELHDTFANDESIYIDGVSLVLSGHYCSGQWRIPGFGILYHPVNKAFFPDENGLVGIQSMLGVTQYISPGLGASNVYPFPIRTMRFGTSPAFTIINLTKVLSAQ